MEEKKNIDVDLEKAIRNFEEVMDNKLKDLDEKRERYRGAGCGCIIIIILFLLLLLLIF